MTDKRDLVRAEARRLRAWAKEEARRKAGLAHERVLNAVRKAQSIIVDQSFAETLRSRGVQGVPQLLVSKANPTQGGNDYRSECSCDPSLEFVIVWTFFFPLIADPVIAAHIDKSWPSFTVELKEAFISLVLDGPLPQQIG